MSPSTTLVCMCKAYAQQLANFEAMTGCTSCQQNLQAGMHGCQLSVVTLLVLQEGCDSWHHPFNVHPHNSTGLTQVTCYKFRTGNMSDPESFLNPVKFRAQIGPRQILRSWALLHDCESPPISWRCHMPACHTSPASKSLQLIELQ